MGRGAGRAEGPGSRALGVIVVDTSAWVEFLRATGSRTHEKLRTLIAEDAPLATTDVVVMELLAGAPTEARVRELRRFLLRFHHLPTGGLGDFERAAAVYRRCRRGGETVRSLSDCLVAAAALRAGASVLGHDRDFEVMARHVGLALAD